MLAKMLLLLSLVEALHLAINKARQEVESAAAVLQERGLVLRGELEASPWFARIKAAKTAYDVLKTGLAAARGQRPQRVRPSGARKSSAWKPS